MRKRMLAIAFFGLCAMGCGDTYESSIPSVTFSFSCSLAQSPYYKITTPGQFLKVTKNVNGLPVGFAGLIIGQSVYSDGHTYVAFDAACPIEANRNISVVLQDDGLGTAQCPQCHATFGLSIHGSRTDNKGQELLKSYKVLVSGNTLQIRN